MENHNTSINTLDNYQNISEQNTRLENFDKLKSEFKSSTFENFMNNIENSTEDHEIIFSEFLNWENITPKDLSDIKLDLWIISKNNEKIDNDIQCKISKIFLQKLYEKNQNYQDFLDKFLTDFWPINKITNTCKINLSTLVNKLSSYDKKYIWNLSIRNQEIFNKCTNIHPLQKFSEQTPSNQLFICQLLNLELSDILDNFQWMRVNLYKDMQSIMTPNRNLAKNLEISDYPDNEDMFKLLRKKHELEMTWNYDEQTKNELNTKNKEIWTKYLLYFYQNEKTKDVTQILEKLLHNNFNFSALDQSEKTILAQKSISNNIAANNTFASRIGINNEDYNKFIQNLYDFNKTTETINVWDKELKLNIKKDFEDWEHLYLQNFENFKDMDQLPLSFTVNIDDNDPEIINMLEDPQNIVLSREINHDGIISTYITKSGPVRIWNNYTIEICWQTLNAEILKELLDTPPEKLQWKLEEYNLQTYFSWWNYQNKFSNFLADNDIKIIQRNLNFNDPNKISQLYLLNHLNNAPELLGNDKKVENLINGESREQTTAKNFASDIYEQIKDSIVINEDENDDEPFAYDSDGIIANAQTYYTQLDDDWKEAFEKELRNLCENDNWTLWGYWEVIADDIMEWLYDRDSNPTNTIVEQADTPEKAFEKEWNKIKWRKDCEFKDWTRLYIKTLDSELPPEDRQESFFVFELCNVQWKPWEGTFWVKAIWNELKLEHPWKIYDWLPYTAEHLSKMAKSGTIYKMPARTNNSRLDCIKRVQESGAVEDFTAFGDMSDQVELVWDKFVNKDWEEIKYFDNYTEGDMDTSWKKVVQWKKPTKYEIKWIDTRKWTVKIASDFDWFDRSDPWKVKPIRYKYENELPFEQFILLIESKKLKWYTEEQQEDIDSKYNIEKKDRLAGRWMFRMVSIWNFISIFKAQWKKIKDLYKENQKEQEEHLENFLLSEEWLNLYKHMWNIFSLWWLLWDVKLSFDEAELDYYNNRDDRVRKKIDKRYKKFGSDPIYPAEYASHLKNILLKWWYRWEDKDRYQFAAAVLIMLKKEGPYPRDFKNQPWDWYRVEAFLWGWHKDRFKDAYAKKLNEINEVKDMWYSSSVKMEKQAELNKMEFQYIISVIDGAAPYASDDENAQKSIRSAKFKDELQSNLDNYYDNQEEEKNKLKTFTAAEEAYLRTLWAWRFNKALPALQAMCEKATTPWEIFRLKWYLISAMLMWAIKNHSSLSTMKTFWKTARSMWFSPLCWARDPNHPEKVEKLLEWISSWDSNIANFSEVGFELKNFTTPGITWDYDGTNIKLLNYRKANWKQILQYIENPTFYNKETSTEENSIKARADAKQYPNRKIFADILKFNNDEDPGNTNTNVTSINYMKVAPLTATGNIVKHYMPREWVYKTEKEEDLSDAKDLRNSISNEIAKADPKNIEFFMKYFLNIFNNKIDTIELVRTISLIENLKKHNKFDEAQYIWWYIFNWSMHKTTQWTFPEEFGNCFENFSKLFFNCIWNTMTESVIKKVFKNDALEYKRPYKMVNRKQRNEKMWWDDIYYNTTGGAFKNNLRDLWYYQEDTINYIIKSKKKDLKRYGVQFKKIPSALISSTDNFNFIYDEENDQYTLNSNSTPIPTTKSSST